VSQFDILAFNLRFRPIHAKPANFFSKIVAYI
jgi:hypothetical protein